LVAPETRGLSAQQVRVSRTLSLLPADHLTPAEVAARLQVCRATVYKLIARGELAHVRVGLSVRIAPADLDAYLAARRTGGRR
jgi:excisionase family DNA binding protein